MQKSMTLEDLLSEVTRQTAAKKDYVASTQDNVRVISGAIIGKPEVMLLVLLQDGHQKLQQLTISENAHRQISSRLSIPWKYYSRLLHDHMDLVIDQINALFEREPATRLFRALDGEVRAFLSNRYLRLDNEEVLCNTLPSIVKGDLETTLLGSNVDANNMHMKVLFTGDELAHEVAKANGEPRIIRPGFRLSNSETGRGSLKIETFFFDSYCTNGCVFGQQEAFNFSRTHIGGRLIESTDFEVISDKSRELEDKLIISQVNDAMHAISNPDNVRKMADVLRTAASTDSVKNPVEAVDLVVKELDLQEGERNSILETFMRDQDYTKFGLASAVTELANHEESCSFSRTIEIENVGAQILNLNLRQWSRIVNAEAIAA